MTNTKKYLGGITAALVLTVGLVGCGSRTETSTPSTTSTKAPATTTTTKDVLESVPQSVKIEALVGVLQEEFPGTSRSEALELAGQACDVIDQEGSVIDAISAVASDPDIDYSTGKDITFIIGVSIPVLCPEYLNELNRIIND